MLSPMKFPPIHARVILGVKGMQSRTEKYRVPVKRAASPQANPASLAMLSLSKLCENYHPEPSSPPPQTLIRSARRDPQIPKITSWGEYESVSSRNESHPLFSISYRRFYSSGRFG